MRPVATRLRCGEWCLYYLHQAFDHTDARSPAQLVGKCLASHPRAPVAPSQMAPWVPPPNPPPAAPSPPTEPAQAQAEVAAEPPEADDVVDSPAEPPWEANGNWQAKIEAMKTLPNGGVAMHEPCAIAFHDHTDQRDDRPTVLSMRLLTSMCSPNVVSFWRSIPSGLCACPIA